VAFPKGYSLAVNLERCRQVIADAPRMEMLLRGVMEVLGEKTPQMLAQRLDGGYRIAAVGDQTRGYMNLYPRYGEVDVRLFTRLEVPVSMDVLMKRFLKGCGAKLGKGTLMVSDEHVTRLLKRAKIDLGTVVFEHASPLQHIEVTQGPRGISLLLDDNWQFVEDTERAFHELLVHIPCVFASKLDRLGIAGGGDGLPAREALRWQSLQHIDLYEIDPFMLEIARSHPSLRRLNTGALLDERVSVYAADALEMLDQPERNYDVLILDFPSFSHGTSTRKDFSALYSPDVYRKAARALAQGGVVITQVTDNNDVFARVVRNMGMVFPHVFPIVMNKNVREDVLTRGLPGVAGPTTATENAADFNFVMASPRAFSQVRSLPRGLTYLDQEMLDEVLWAERLPRKASDVFAFQKNSQVAAASPTA
jgi:spermidine synthase